MKKNIILFTALLFLLQTFTLLSAVQGAEKKAAAAKAKVVSILKTEKEVNAKGINDPIWQEAETLEIPLTTAPPVHPSVSGTASVSKIAVQGVITKKDVIFRLSWEDSTMNNQINVTGFSDRAAIQFPLSKKTDTGIIMGGGGKAVNIWQWVSAGNKAENFVSDGFGTLTKSDNQYVFGTGEFKNGHWTIVIFRPLEMKGKGDIVFDKKSIPAAFAVWNGSNQERDGLKAATMEWVNLQIK